MLPIDAPWPWASWALALTCVLLWVLRKEAELVRLSSTNLTMTANAVVGGPFAGKRAPWVLFTSLFHHATRAHLVNNTFMLLVTAGEIEVDVGAARLVALFLATGAAGWCATMAFTRWMHAEAWRDGVAQFNESVGSSPATYGLALFASARFPLSAPVGAALGSPPFWLLCAGITFLPMLVDTDDDALSEAKTASQKLHQKKWLPAAALSAAVLPLLAARGFEGSAAAFFCWYTSQKIAPQVAHYLLDDGHHSSADHACHMGGGCLGLSLGLATTANFPSVYRAGIIAFCVTELLGRLLLACQPAKED